MKKEHSNGLSRNLVGAIVLVLGIAAAFALFYSSNVRRITRQNENYIADIAFQRADLIEDLFRENLAYIDSAAIVLETEFENQEIDAAKLNVPDESDIDATELAQVADILRIYEERFAFDYLRFIDLYGRDYTTGEKVIAANVSDFSELCSFDLNERRIHEFREPACDLCFSYSRRAHHKDVLRRDLLSHLFGEKASSVAVSERYCYVLLGFVLADDIFIELRYYLFRSHVFDIVCHGLLLKLFYCNVIVCVDTDVGSDLERLSDDCLCVQIRVLKKCHSC